jgi:uncharacterized membrane protein
VTAATSTPRPLAALDPRRALGKSAIAIVVAILVAAFLSDSFNPIVAALGGWDAGGIALLSLSWLTIYRCDPAKTQARAGAEDPGRTAVYLLVTLTSSVSLFAAVLVSRKVHLLAGEGERTVLLALCLATVALSWLLTQTSFTFRYARLYYRDDREGIGGIDLPGGAPPSYFDFAYFAFTVGMCFQTSDATVTSPQIRRVVLLHAVLSFAYNTVIVAFALNLVFSSVG